jgi:archaellum component FlaC
MEYTKRKRCDEEEEVQKDKIHHQEKYDFLFLQFEIQKLKINQEKTQIDVGILEDIYLKIDTMEKLINSFKDSPIKLQRICTHIEDWTQHKKQRMEELEQKCGDLEKENEMLRQDLLSLEEKQKTTKENNYDFYG